MSLGKKSTGQALLSFGKDEQSHSPTQRMASEHDITPAKSLDLVSGATETKIIISPKVVKQIHVYGSYLTHKKKLSIT